MNPSIAARPYDVVLFDFDHTLFDSDAAERHAFGSALTAADIDDPFQYFEHYLQINDAMWRAVERGEMSQQDVHLQRFEQLVAETSLDADIDIVDLGANFLDGLAAGGDWYPGAAPMLDSLIEAGLRLALVTNAMGEVQRPRLERLGAEGYFDPIVISTEIGVAKPSSAFFEITMRRLGDPPPASVLIVGDSLTSDIAGGAGFGIDTCWYNPHRKPADPNLEPTHQVDTYDRVVDLLNG